MNDTPDAGPRRPFVKFELVVTSVCFLIPFLLMFGDVWWSPREHISGYYTMRQAGFFYVPLTMAAMLFVINGVVRGQHWYNIGLGLALGGVIVFNHVDYFLIHNISVGAFFIGNALVFVLFTPKDELWLKVIFALLMAALLAGHFVFGLYSLFWGEAFSLWVIALHFLLEALEVFK